MKKTTVKITRYEAGEWYVDIHDIVEWYEAWLRRNDFGVSILMFGMPKDQVLNNGEKDITDLNSFLELVEENLEEYQCLYDREYVPEV